MVVFFSFSNNFLIHFLYDSVEMVPNSNRIYDLEQMYLLCYMFSMIYVSIKTKINLMVKTNLTIYKYFSNKWFLKKKAKACDLESRVFYKPRIQLATRNLLQDFALCPTQDYSYKNTIKFTSNLIQNVLNKVE